MARMCSQCGKELSKVAFHSVQTCLDNLRKERDDADRRAGAAERYLENKTETLFALNKSRDEKKIALGYDRDATFDIVFQDLIDLLGGWDEAKRKCLELPNERRRR